MPEPLQEGLFLVWVERQARHLGFYVDVYLLGNFGYLRVANPSKVNNRKLRNIERLEATSNFVIRTACYEKLEVDTILRLVLRVVKFAQSSGNRMSSLVLAFV